MTENSKSFEAIQIEEAVAILNSGLQTSTPVLCWTKNQGHTFQASINSVFAASGVVFFSFFKNIEAEAFQEVLERDNISEIFVSLQLKTDVVFFKAELRRVDDKFIHFRMIDPMFKVQRRAGLRLPIPEHLKVVLQFEYPVETGLHVTAPILDLSSGGVAILLTDQPCRDEFSTGYQLGKVEFTVSSRKLNCLAEVRYAREISFSKQKKAVKVGIQFKGLSEKDRTFIAEYVFEESSKYYGRIAT